MAERICSVDGCGKKHYGQGYCAPHWGRFKRHGDPLVVMRDRDGTLERNCSVESCDRPWKGQGFCAMHRGRWQRHGDPLFTTRMPTGSTPLCTVHGCDKPYESNGYCSTHRARWVVTGDPLKLRRPELGVCGVPACVEPVKIRGWCFLHADEYPDRACTRCGARSRDVAFGRETAACDGLRAKCKDCSAEAHRQAYRSLDSEQLAERHAQGAAWYAANRETALAQQHDYRLRNIDKIRERDRARVRGPESAARAKAWRVANRDQYRATLRRWHQANKDTYPSGDPARRIARRGTGAPVEKIRRRDVWEAHDGICGICGIPVAIDVMHIDHVLPISRGGGHVWENVQPTHKFCNLSKKNREVAQWRLPENWPPRPMTA